MAVKNFAKTICRTLMTGWCSVGSLAFAADTFIPYGSPSIDGILAPNEWQELSHIRMARFYGMDQFADFWLLWDDDNLYIAGKLQDDTVHEDGNGGETKPWETWHDDSLEIYLHPDWQPPNKVNQESRILAFTPTGKFQRLDRGRWEGDKPEVEVTTGLETFANTITKIDPPFFNDKVINQNWQTGCSGGLPAPPPQLDTVVRFASKIDEAGFRGWQFEVAWPWRLIGTEIKKKAVHEKGEDCQVGDGIFPTLKQPHDGLSMRVNFYRINDDDGGEVDPHFKGIMTDSLGNKSSDGMLYDEWFVYQGDRFHPNEWAAFVLSDQRELNPDEVPQFHSKKIDSWPVSAIDGRRVRLGFEAPTRGNGGSAYRYAIRYQEGGGGVDENRWQNMTEFEQAYFPAPPNVWQEVDVIALEPDKTYTFAVRAIDELGRMSKDILSTTETLPNDDRDSFITVSPTGRSLVFSDGKPFVVVGETGLMPWLPLRGVYDGKLCDENPDKFLIDPLKESKGQYKRRPLPEHCSKNVLDKNGENKTIDGVYRRYYSEDIFYDCFFPKKKEKCENKLDGKTYSPPCIVAKLKNSDQNLRENCKYVFKGEPNRKPVQAEGPNVTEDYFKKLQKNGVNVVTVFVESLDLNVTPIFLIDQDSSGSNPEDIVLNQDVKFFLEELLKLAKQYDVYLLFRLYDTFYYKDNSYKEDGRKWQDTYWFKQLGAKSPENFFDEDLYPYHQERMRPLLMRYRDEPHVLGWDLVNEIDNRVRFNAAPFEKRKKWLEEMVRFAQKIDRNHLIFYSFLTWDPKDDTVYRASSGEEESYIGMDAELAYRMQDVDLAVPHAYYAHIANPWDTNRSPDYAPALEMVRGITYGFYQIRDGRPILDGESSPNGHLFHKSYGDDGFTEEIDNEMFFTQAWLHFVSGGAGANLRWPADLRDPDKQSVRETMNQIGDTKRKFLKFFKDNVGDLSWRGDQMVINHRKLDNNIVAVTRHDKRNAVVFLYNPDKIGLQNFTFPELPSSHATVKIVKPRDGDVLYDNQNRLVGTNHVISINNPIHDHVAIIVRDMTARPTVAESELVTNDLWIRAIINTERQGDLEAKWVGHESETSRGDRVIQGYFYADPTQVDWGNKNNPEMFVKIWFDVDGRVDVNFFYASVSEIEVYSGMEQIEPYASYHRSTRQQRYVRHTYRPHEGTLDSSISDTTESLTFAPDASPTRYPMPFQGIEIGSIIETEEGPIDGVWKLGGSATTQRGEQVAWGFFYADPNQVGWGNENNPEVYVKFWFDPLQKRIDVNFFHFSSTNINVYSGRGEYEQGSLITPEERYSRHEYFQ